MNLETHQGQTPSSSKTNKNNNNAHELLLLSAARSKVPQQQQQHNNNHYSPCNLSLGLIRLEINLCGLTPMVLTWHRNELVHNNNNNSNNQQQNEMTMKR
jgi:hypothetical protein